MMTKKKPKPWCFARHSHSVTLPHEELHGYIQEDRKQAGTLRSQELLHEQLHGVLSRTKIGTLRSQEQPLKCSCSARVVSSSASRSRFRCLRAARLSTRKP